MNLTEVNTCIVRFGVVNLYLVQLNQLSSKLPLSYLKGEPDRSKNLYCTICVCSLLINSVERPVLKVTQYLNTLWHFNYNTCVGTRCTTFHIVKFHVL